MPAYPFFLLSESHDPTSRHRGIGAVRWFRVNGNRSGEIPNLSKAQAALSDSIFWRSNVYTPEAPRKTAFYRSGIRTGRTMNIPSRNIRNRVFNIGLTPQIYEKNSPPHKFLTYFFTFSKKYRSIRTASAKKERGKANNRPGARFETEFFRKRHDGKRPDFRHKKSSRQPAGQNSGRFRIGLIANNLQVAHTEKQPVTVSPQFPAYNMPYLDPERFFGTDACSAKSTKEEK